MTNTSPMLLVSFSLALAVVALVFVGMHERHYERRKFQLLEARLAGVERIVTGDHDL